MRNALVVAEISAALVPAASATRFCSYQNPAPCASACLSVSGPTASPSRPRVTLAAVLRFRRKT
jgi:hypothetical protein